MADSFQSSTIEDERELTPRELWSTEIDYAERELKKFHERGDRVVRRFIDERDATEAGQKWFNLFYANTKILKAALYAQVPIPEVCRRFSDYNDDVARVAATILQRSISPDHDDPRDLFDSTMKSAVLDRLVPGLAVAWCRLETDTEDVELMLEEGMSVGEKQEGPTHHDAPVNSGFATARSPDDVAPAQPPGVSPAEGPPSSPSPGASGSAGQPPTQPEKTFKRITDQRVSVDYVYWKDFVWSPCRVWAERRWIGRKVYMDRQELVKRFGEEKGKAIPLNYRPNHQYLTEGSTPKNVTIQRACIYEIWDRLHRKVIWFCKEYDELLDSRDDFLNLVGFEPCPTPLFANITTSNTVPRPDFYLVQDQYNELDTVNNRISMLVRAIRVVGVYDKAAEGVQRMLGEGTDNQLIPVDNWALFAEKGGIKGQVDWLPLEQITNAVARLYESREAIKAQIYELTGIADIVRGASKASETLGAQEIKAKFASVRIKDVQDEAARFASEILRIKAEIMVKHFDPEILRRKSNIMHTDDAQVADMALKLLQSEEGFEWRITVTTDQLAQTDYNLEKQDRIELLTSVSKYLQVAGQMFMQMPQSGPLLVGLLKWAVAGFKGARDIESMLDRELDNMLKTPQQPPKEDPEMVKAKAKIESDKAHLQMEGQEHQQDMQFKVQEHQLDMRGKQQELQFDMIKGQQEIQMQREKNAADFQTDRMKAAMNIQNSQAQADVNLHATAMKNAEQIRLMKTKKSLAPKSKGNGHA